MQTGWGTGSEMYDGVLQSREMLTTGEVAAHCGVSFRTVLRWIQKGYLKSSQLPGRGDNRILIDDVVEFLHAHQMPIPDKWQNRLPSILIVDDDPVFVNSLQRLFMPLNIPVHTSPDGFQAASLLHRHHSKILILDLNMPGLCGLGVIRYVTSTHELSATRIIVVSGLDAAELQKAVDVGAHAAVHKTRCHEELLPKVKDFLLHQPPKPESIAEVSP